MDLSFADKHSFPSWMSLFCPKSETGCFAGKIHLRHDCLHRLHDHGLLVHNSDRIPQPYHEQIHSKPGDDGGDVDRLCSMSA